MQILEQAEEYVVVWKRKSKIGKKYFGDFFKQPETFLKTLSILFSLLNMAILQMNWFFIN